MKPLSLILHIKSNIKRLLPTILTVALEFAALTFMISIGIGVIYAVNYNLSAYFDKTIYIKLEENIDNVEVENLINNINNLEEVDIATIGEVINSPAMLPLMYSGTPFYKVDINNIEEFVKGFDTEIIKGTFPKDKNEIMLTEENSNLSNASVGEWIGVDYDNTLDLNDNYKVVGIIKGKYSYTLCGYDSVRDSKMIVVQCQKGKVNSVKREIEEMNTLNIEVKDTSDLRFFVDNIRGILLRLGSVALGIFSIVILITVINLSKSIISNFTEEYSLLRAIGYRSKVIKNRINSQLGFILGCASIVGVILGSIINVLFNNLFCIPRGIPYSELNIYMLLPIGIAIFLFIIITININRKVSKMEFMSKLEL